MSEAERMLEEQPLDVIDEISPRDAFWRGKWKGYAHAGNNALRCIRLSMLAAGKQDVEAILDFGCGHGRVLRVLKAAFPGASLTACDIDVDGIEFCSRVLDATPVQSDMEPAKIEMDGSFDLIWCGSVLTHMDAECGRGFLALFEQRLVSDGLLVFTTAGRRVVERMRSGELDGLTEAQALGLINDYERSGFGYRDYVGRTGWGLSRATPAWVCRELEMFPALRIVSLTERGWGKRQDVVACLKVAEPS